MVAEGKQKGNQILGNCMLDAGDVQAGGDFVPCFIQQGLLLVASV